MTVTDPHASIRADLRADLARTAPGVSPLVTWTLAHRDGVTPFQRLVLATLALTAEAELRTGDGYNGHTVAQIALISLLTEDQTQRVVRSLIRRGFLVHSPLNPAVIRLPEEAFNH